MKVRIPLLAFISAGLLLPMVWLSAQSSSAPREQLIGYLNGLANSRLNARKGSVQSIRTRVDADRRKAEVRKKILQLIGGLPEHSLPFDSVDDVKEFRRIAADGFQVETIAYQSLPGFWVTADLYVPTSGTGPFPAVVLAPGHGAGGKTENWSWGGNFARNGIIALAYDPIGQGERLQYYDSKLQKSFIGNPTGEHGEANIGPLLIGDDIARYMVNDAMRGVDYLISRKDVDGSRIGAFGCSGGGTSTAYFAALDDRVKVAATACYITSFKELLQSPTGAQDAEQSVPRFIDQGLDFADWVEAFAPKPYAVISTMDDMFPFEGARQTVEEVKQFYAAYSADDRIQWITGPGGHGNLGPVSPAIMKFFTKNLKGSDDEATFTPLRASQTADMIVTPTGQVSTAFGRVATVYSMNRQRAATLMAAQPVLSTKDEVLKLQKRLGRDIRSLTGTVMEPGTSHSVVTTKSMVQHDGYRVETISMTSDAPMEVAGMIAIPDVHSAKPAVLMLNAPPDAAAEMDRLAKSGRIVMMLEPRPTSPGPESIKSPYLGPFNLLSLRAFLVGKTIIGLRVDDAIRAVDWLVSRKDVDRKSITLYGNGPLGMVALHAVALDARISKLVVENTLTSYRMIVDEPVHRNVSEVVIPGVLRHYDTNDLLMAVYPRPVTYIAPQDALGEPITKKIFLDAVLPALESDKKLGTMNRIQFQEMTSGDGMGVWSRRE